MSAYNSSNMLVSAYIGTPTPTKKTVARQTDCSLNQSAAEIDISSKTSSRYGEFLSGRLSGELSFDAFIETAPGSGEASIVEMQTIFAAGTANKWAVASTISGTQSSEFFAIMTKFDQKFSQESGASYSITLRITGAPTVALIA